eukprot:scpid77578/ scgid16178/ 
MMRLPRVWPLVLLPCLVYVVVVTIHRSEWIPPRRDISLQRPQLRPASQRSLLKGNSQREKNRNPAQRKQADDQDGPSWPDFWTVDLARNLTSTETEKTRSGVSTSAYITPASELTDVTEQAENQSSRILAVGWFSHEQLTRSTMQLADFLAIAVAARRDAVQPVALGNHLVSMAASGNVPAKSRRELKPRVLSSYFDLKNIKREMLLQGGSRFISESEARSQCAGNWSLLYLVSDWQYMQPLCKFRKDLLPTERATMKRLQSAEHSIDSVDNNCTWVEKCLEPKLLSLGPFRNTVCAAFPKTRWTIESLVSQLDIFESSECLLLPIWYGMGRHGIVQAPQRAPTFPLTALKTSANLRRLSQRLLHLAGLGSNYTAVHVRMEHIRSQYRKMKARGELQTGDSKQFALNCFNALLKFLKETVHTNSSLILGSDQRSESLRHNQEVQNLRQKLLNDLREIPLRVITVDEIVEKYSSADNNRVLRNPGM